MGITITYGSYLGDKKYNQKPAAKWRDWIPSLQVMAVGIAIFPAVFSLWSGAGQGPGFIAAPCQRCLALH